MVSQRKGGIKLGPEIPSHQELRCAKSWCWISGLVFLEAIQDFTDEREESQTTLESQPLQTHTCWASSIIPQRGHAKDSRCCQWNMNLPTPHIPVECLRIKFLHVMGTCLEDNKAASQSTVDSSLFVRSLFPPQYLRAGIAWTIVYMALSLSLDSFTSSFHIDQASCGTVKCRWPGTARHNSSLALRSIWIFNKAHLSSSPRGLSSSWCPLTWWENHFMWDCHSRA